MPPLGAHDVTDGKSSTERGLSWTTCTSSHGDEDFSE